MWLSSIIIFLNTPKESAYFCVLVLKNKIKYLIRAIGLLQFNIFDLQTSIKNRWDTTKVLETGRLMKQDLLVFPPKLFNFIWILKPCFSLWEKPIFLQFFSRMMERRNHKNIIQFNCPPGFWPQILTSLLQQCPLD